MGVKTERKASFFTSESRFQYYEQLAKKTNVFIGPGVYEDHKNFI